MLSDYCKKWVKYAHNDISIAVREMNLAGNPRHKAYEAMGHGDGSRVPYIDRS